MELYDHNLPGLAFPDGITVGHPGEAPRLPCAWLAPCRAVVPRGGRSSPAEGQGPLPRAAAAPWFAGRRSVWPNSRFGPSAAPNYAQTSAQTQGFVSEINAEGWDFGFNFQRRRQAVFQSGRAPHVHTSTGRAAFA